MSESARAEAPRRIAVYVCRTCGVWTIHRRDQCVWCPTSNPAEKVTYMPVEDEEA